MARFLQVHPSVTPSLCIYIPTSITSVLYNNHIHHAYATLYLTLPTCPPPLSLRAQGDHSDVIMWLEKKETKSDLYQRPNLTARLIIAPITVAGLILTRGSGLADLMKHLTSALAAVTRLAMMGGTGNGAWLAAMAAAKDGIASIIPFDNAATVLGGPAMEGVSYVIGACFATLVTVLQRMNLLL